MYSEHLVKSKLFKLYFSSLGYSCCGLIVSMHNIHIQGRFQDLGIFWALTSVRWILSRHYFGMNKCASLLMLSFMPSSVTFTFKVRVSIIGQTKKTLLSRLIHYLCDIKDISSGN